tara:strand:+ start:43995 stop:47636 length:3642 start_codon:yes stop_codon:yes gene_type:complete
MPKETYTLSSFERGLITSQEARDLEQDAIPGASGFDFSKKGKVKILGDGFKDALDPTLASYFTGGLAERERILTFRHDYDLGVEGEWSKNEIFSGYMAPPTFREKGVQYYVVTSGENRNEITLIASHENDAGEQVFSTIPWDEPTYNSTSQGHPHESFTEGTILNFDLDQNGFNQRNQKMHVGPDANADIVGYWVNNGFRYCDANFENKNNNIVGYFGHINRKYLSNLDSIRLPSDGEPSEDQYNPYANTSNSSFTRNHWHFQTYEDYFSLLGPNAELLESIPRHPYDDTNGAVKFKDKTAGFTGFLKGSLLTTDRLDGQSNWNSDGKPFNNYQISTYAFPNLERIDDNTNEIVSSVAATASTTPLHEGTMEDGHELRRKWMFGSSILYDGDPKGICQETGIAKTHGSSKIDGVRIYEPNILNLKDISEHLDYETDGLNPWVQIGSTTNGNAITTTDGVEPATTNFIPGDFNALPKIVFNWTFLPWWADTDKIIPATESNHLSTDRPLWDARVVGFRIYMRDIEDEAKTWYNLATIDALRGMIYYNGCNIESEPWVPLGMLDETNGLVQRWELSEQQEIINNWSHRIPLWGNSTLGRNGVKWESPHNHNTRVLVSSSNYDIYIPDTEISALTDPYKNCGVNQSVNIESIPDHTYELLNGYKHNYSPTMLSHVDKLKGNVEWIHDFGGDDPETEDEVEEEERRNVARMAESYGNIYRFKTSAILNDRVYIGNIMDVDTQFHQPDRILKTEPGQHDIFPDDGFHHIDLATGDGDSIVHMITYNGKLFVWKHHTLYVIKILDDGQEVIESTHYNHGIDNKYHVIITQHGPCWFNKAGLYLYTHENKIDNLIEDKIMRGVYIKDMSEFYGSTLNDILGSGTSGGIQDYISNIIVGNPGNIHLFDVNDDGILDVLDIVEWTNLILDGDVDAIALFEDFELQDLYVSQVAFGWKGFVASDGLGKLGKPMIGYLPNDNKIIIYKSSDASAFPQVSGDAYIYDFTLKNFSYGKKVFPSGKNVIKSNFVNDAEGNLLYLASYNDPEGVNESEIKILQWDNASTNKFNVEFKTKDIDFGSPGLRKKVYKIYVSVAGQVQPNVQVLYSINGSDQFSPLNRFEGVQNYDVDTGFMPGHESTSFNSSSPELENQWYTAVLKPSSSGQSLNNIYSIQLLFTGRNYGLDVNLEPTATKLGSNSDIGDFVSSTFQINDITIVYRAKNAR